VDTYGICRYKELNPAIVSVVTFPFLFGMMFGDVGHGSLLLFIGIFLSLKADYLKQNGLAALAAARYIVLLMGLFACYGGFIYNEFFAMPLNLFSSCYETDKEGQFVRT
jgi:V-type H+-transporting ATPase subunit a